MNLRFLFIFFALALKSTAEFLLRDVPGTYQLERGNHKKCAGKIALTVTGTRLLPTDIIADGAYCSGSSVHLGNGTGAHRWGPNKGSKVGAIITVKHTPGCMQRNLKCGSKELNICSAYFVWPTEDVELNLGTLPPFLHRRARRYFAVHIKPGGSCIYRASNTATSSPTALPSRDPPVIVLNSENHSLWTWLGPVLGAVSTIGAAFVGVTCFRAKEKEIPKAPVREPYPKAF